MLSFKRIALLATLIPIGGLTSCRKDTKTPSTAPAWTAPASTRERGPSDELYSGPAGTGPRGRSRIFAEPTVVHQGQRLGLQSWGQSIDRDLKLDDAIDVGKPAPRITEIQTRCGEGADMQIQNFTFDGVAAIPMFKLLPTAMLARNLHAAPVHCTFLINLGDDRVHLTGFPMVARMIDDYGSLDIGGPTLSRRDGFPEVRASKLLGHTIEQTGADHAEAQLVCADLTFPTLAFYGRLDLATFDLARFETRRGVDRDKIAAEQPDQLCRVVIADHDSQLRLQMTKLFNLRFNQQKFSVRYVPDDSRKQGTMHEGEEFHLARYTVTNLEDEPLALRFNQQPYEVAVALNLKDDVDGISTVANRRWAYIYHGTPTGEKQLGPDQAFQLGPHASQTFHLKFRVGGDIHCMHLRVRVKPLEDIYLHEVRGNTVLNSVQLEKPDWQTKIQFFPDYVFDESRRHEASGCYW